MLLWLLLLHGPLLRGIHGWLWKTASLAWDGVEDSLSCVGYTGGCGRRPLLRGMHVWLWKTASLAWDARVAVEDGLSCVGCTCGCGRRPLLQELCYIPSNSLSHCLFLSPPTKALTVVLKVTQLVCTKQTTNLLGVVLGLLCVFLTGGV